MGWASSMDLFILLGLHWNLKLRECRMAVYVPIESEHIVVEELKSMTNNWYTLGINLGLKPSTLNQIEGHYICPHGPARCLYQLIVKWWQLNPHATWGAVITALRKSEEIRLAKYIENKYKLPSRSPSAQRAEKRQIIIEQFSDIEKECDKTKREIKKVKDKVKTLEDHLENLRKTRDGLKTELLQLLDEVDEDTDTRRLSVASNHSVRIFMGGLTPEDEKSLNEEIFELLRKGRPISLKIDTQLSSDSNPSTQLPVATPNRTEHDGFQSTHWTHSTLPRRRRPVNTTAHQQPSCHPRHTRRLAKESNV